MVPVPMARRLVRIPVLPRAMVSKAATFCVSGGGDANARCELRNFPLTQAPATPAELARRNFLRSMPASGFLLYRTVRRRWGRVGYRAVWLRATPYLHVRY